MLETAHLSHIFWATVFPFGVLKFTMAEVLLSDETISDLATRKSQEEFYDRDFPLGGSFGLRVGKGGRKAFFLIYNLNGKRRRMTLGCYPVIGLEEARYRATSLIRLVEQGRDPARESRRGQGIFRFDQLCLAFENDHLASCKEKTRKEYLRIIHKELLPSWELLKISSIGQEEITSLMKRIAQTRKKPVMANRVRNVVGKLFAYAGQQGLIANNPVREISPAQVQEKQPRILNEKEMVSFWQALQGEDLVVASLFKILLLTGQRATEVMSMRWRDIEFDTWLVGGKDGVSPRRIFLTRQIKQVLGQLREEALDGEYVFRCDGPIPRLNNAVRRINKGMHVTTPWTTRDLQRTVEVQLRILGVRPDVVEKLMNRNSSVKGLSRRLGIKDPDYAPLIKQALTLLGRKVSELVGRASVSGQDSRIIPLFPL